MVKMDKVEIFERILTPQPFKKKFNFLQKGNTDFYTDSLGDNHKILFKNEKRGVLVILGLANENNHMGDNCSVIISNEDLMHIDDIPYFLLTEWLDSSGREEDWKKFYLNWYEGSYEEKLKSFF